MCLQLLSLTVGIQIKVSMTLCPMQTEFLDPTYAFHLKHPLFRANYPTLRLEYKWTLVPYEQQPHVIEIGSRIALFLFLG